MLIHTVLFWLKDGLSSDQITAFEAALETMKGIEHAEAVYVGTPSATEKRPVIDTSYDYCLTVVLKDVAAHDAYQVDPIHTEFLNNKDLWAQVKIYDAD
ncbi:MAG: Dabb family protein [Opitutaceae bacterium]